METVNDQQFIDTFGFVTGDGVEAGAGSDRAVPIGLTQCGADIRLFTRTEAHAEQASVTIDALGRHALAATEEVGARRACREPLDGSPTSPGGVDIGVSNAGIDVDVDGPGAARVQDWEAHRPRRTCPASFYTPKTRWDTWARLGGGAFVVIGSDSSVVATQRFAA